MTTVERTRRSILAITSVAPARRACATAFSSSGRAATSSWVPDLDLGVGPQQLAAGGGAVRLDGGGLGLEAEPRFALAVGADADQPDQLAARRHGLESRRGEG